MNRGSFIKRAALAVAGAIVAPRQLAAAGESRDAVSAAVVEPAVEAAEAWQVTHGPLVASGGLCAPITPHYVTTERWTEAWDCPSPVRDALPSFRADRGGIRFHRAADAEEPVTFPADWLE